MCINQNLTFLTIISGKPQKTYTKFKHMITTWKYLVSISVLTFSNFITYGQTKPEIDKLIDQPSRDVVVNINRCGCRNGNCDSIIEPLILAGKLRTDFKHLLVDPKKVLDIKVYRGNTRKASKYGDAGKGGVVILKINSNIKLLRPNEILKIYNIDNHDKKLRFCINKNIMKDSKLILVDQAEIENVEITSEILQSNSYQVNSSEKFINIITKRKTGL